MAKKNSLSGSPVLMFHWTAKCAQDMDWRGDWSTIGHLLGLLAGFGFDSCLRLMGMRWIDFRLITAPAHDLHPAIRQTISKEVSRIDRIGMDAVVLGQQVAILAPDLENRPAQFAQTALAFDQNYFHNPR